MRVCVCLSLSTSLDGCVSLSVSLDLSLQFAVTLFFEDVTPVSQNASRSTTPQNIASSNTTSGSSEGLSKPTPSNAAQQQVRRRAGHTLRVPSTYGAVGARSSQDDGVQQQQQQGDGDGDGDGDAEGGTAEMRRATAATSSSGVGASGGGIQRLHRPPSLRPTRPSPRLDEGVRRSRILQGSVRSTLRMEQSACRGEREVVGDAEVGEEAEKEVKEEGEEEA